MLIYNHGVVMADSDELTKIHNEAVQHRAVHDNSGVIPRVFAENYQPPKDKGPAAVEAYDKGWKSKEK